MSGRWAAALVIMLLGLAQSRQMMRLQGTDGGPWLLWAVAFGVAALNGAAAMFALAAGAADSRVWAAAVGVLPGLLGLAAPARRGGWPSFVAVALWSAGGWLAALGTAPGRPLRLTDDPTGHIALLWWVGCLWLAAAVAPLLWAARDRRRWLLAAGALALVASGMLPVGASIGYFLLFGAATTLVYLGLVTSEPVASQLAVRPQTAIRGTSTRRH